jgi:glyoxylase-like metal-dependent hydrolase (beta-lactamase superfamily II)
MCIVERHQAFVEGLTRRDALRLAAIAGGGVAALALARRTTAQPMMPAPTLLQLAEDTYLFSVTGYNTIFIVTDEGVIVTDPSSGVNMMASAQLKAAIQSVTDKPVKYVFYSHDHADHNTGGDVFADTAEFISHTRAAPKIAARNDPRSPVPTITFDDQMTLMLGGKTFELYYTGRNHSDNSIVLLYPDRRLLFAVDFIPVRSLLFRDLQDSYLDEWVDSLNFVEHRLDFDTLVPGHGMVGTKANVREVRDYILDLQAAIRSARAKGLTDSSDEMVAAVRADLEPTYGSWGAFDMFLPLNIEGVIRIWGETGT